MSGIAIRQALSLGLNLRNEDQNLVDSSKEIRYRLWWAIAATERTLSVMTGRPTCFSEIYCSTPLPLPLDEETFMSSSRPRDAAAVSLARRLSTDDEGSPDAAASTPSSMSSRAMPWSPNDSLMPRSSSNFVDGNMKPKSSSNFVDGNMKPKSSSNFVDGNMKPRSSSNAVDGDTMIPNDGLIFLYITKLKVLDDDVLKQLYRPHVLNESWATVQSTMLKLQKRLDRWRSTLPGVFDFTRSQREQGSIRQRMCLGFMYYSTMIIINRPCLCKIDVKIPKESRRARDIDRASAVACVRAAKSLVDLLPDKPNPAGTYQVSPWWNMVHHLMQAATILMLEISYRACHCPEVADELFLASQKVVAWLQSMSIDDLAAARAWRLSSDVLQKIAPRIGRRIDDFLVRPVQSGEDVPMRDFLMPSATYSAPSSTYDSLSIDGNDYTNLLPQSTWEPLMFTSYDNYLIGDPQPPQQPSAQAPSEQQRWK
ncbi:MAG: hypothetical protein Q9170_005302 [Blastenia crenularia]